ncbi:unnamed protein product [Chrysodeixis includens]|uniref:C2H2-type domain-containing protein n=1 Tax=Chrysodeixis includens TaxID=689277 RepID=A0A9P0FYH8_CHRIL|nr:unnamed protein product [Chrysodeixis includens]
MEDLCTACLCSGRNLYFIGETGFYHLYSQILNEMQVYDVSELCVRVCWECRALLRRLQLFKQQVKRSYTELLEYAQTATKPPHTVTPRLQQHHIHTSSYPDIQVKLEIDDTYLEDQLAIKAEDTHCEPETFVNELDMEPVKKKREGREKKVAKPIKEKPKKKVKAVEKTPVKKKIRVKKRKLSPVVSDDGVKTEGEDNMDREDCLQKDVEEEEKDSIKETKRLNGTTKAVKEVLPERPQCAECGKHFSSRKTYKYHLNVLHKGQNRYPCPRCGKVYQWKSNLGRHLRSHKARDSGELYCETCDKRFASVATYRQHLRVSRRHVPESDFSFMCNECGKKFVNKTRLRDHIDWEHLKKIKFRCQLCNKPFKCHTSLYVHMQNVHRNKEKKDNLCHVCGKSYQNAAKLKYHIVAMHTAETPYRCAHCSAAFGWYSSLYRHVREVHYKMKVQPKKSKKSKKSEVLPSLLPPQVVLSQMNQAGPP